MSAFVSTTGPVAIIDIGSNSIKVLIATRAPNGDIVPVKVRTLDARISAGINQAAPRLSEEGMQRGVTAIATLLGDASAAGASAFTLVATSAVRDALNGEDFRARVKAATGETIRILSGDEEANLIGRGLVTDPALRHLEDFYVFDLGGGSLECLSFRARRIEQAVSVRLGCVRLTERFVADPQRPMTPAEIAAISAHTREVVTQSGFNFSLAETAVAVGTGGTVATARAILGGREGRPFEATASTITLAQMRALRDGITALPLEERKKVAGMPPARADVFPTALVTLIALAELGGFTGFQNSLHNLRYGLADATLAPGKAQ